MTQAQHILVCLLAVWLLSFAALAAAPARGMPDLPSADMRLSWEDFKQLLELTIALERELEESAAPEPAPTEDEMPAVRAETLPADTPWAIIEASYDADATQDDAVLVKARLRLQVWQKGWVQVPLFGVDVGMESVLVNETAMPVVLKHNRHVLPIDETGEHLIELVFSVRAPLEEGVAQLTFDGPEATRSRMRLRLPAPDAEVTAPDATRITRTAHEDALEVELVFRRARRIDIAWTIPAALPPPEPEPDETPVEVVPPRFTARSTVLAAVTETHVACDTQVQLDMLRGNLEQFTFVLPASTQVLKVEGKGISWRTEDVDGEQRVTLALNHVVSEHYGLRLHYESAIPDGAAVVTLPRLRVAEAARHNGFVAIATHGNVEVDHHLETEGLRRVDASDLPAELSERAERPILHAFQYADEEHLLALSYRRMQDVPVRVAGIDRAHILSVITEEGLVITHARYMVRNNLKQFMALAIGADAEVWAAQVNHQPVRPGRDAANDNDEAISDDVVLLPLIKSQDGGVDRGAFPVEIIYMRRGDPLEDGTNILPLEAPAADLLANLVEWEVLVPEDYRIHNAEGNLKRAAQAAPWLDAVARRYEGDYTVVGSHIHIGESDDAGKFNTTMYRLREGIERFFITDINNPAATATAIMGEGRYDDARRSDLPDFPKPDTAAATVAGVLPVQFSMPHIGRPIYFERTVLPQQTPLTVTLELHRMAGRAQWLLALAGGALALGLALSAGVRALFQRRYRGYAYLFLTAALSVALFAGVILLGAALMPLVRNAVIAAAFGLSAPVVLKGMRHIMGVLRYE